MLNYLCSLFQSEYLTQQRLLDGDTFAVYIITSDMHDAQERFIAVIVFK